MSGTNLRMASSNDPLKLDYDHLSPSGDKNPGNYVLTATFNRCVPAVCHSKCVPKLVVLWNPDIISNLGDAMNRAHKQTDLIIMDFIKVTLRRQ